MPVFRIEKTKNYTVMSNHHLKNANISLKAKGLLSVMLSLPDKWNYTLKGLASICKEGIDSVRNGINELEKAGYIQRNRLRSDTGKFSDIEYVIYEQPLETFEKHPELENPILDNPTLENSDSDNPMLEKATQLNKEIINKKDLNTDCINYPSINHKESENKNWTDIYNQNVKLIKNNIEYSSISVGSDKAVIDEIVSVMAEILTIDTPFYVIESKQYPTELVRKRLLEIDYNKLEAFLLDFSRRTEKIYNPKAYLISSLFNMPATADTALSNMVRNDLYG